MSYNSTASTHRCLAWPRSAGRAPRRASTVPSNRNSTGPPHLRAVAWSLSPCPASIVQRGLKRKLNGSSTDLTGRSHLLLRGPLTRKGFDSTVRSNLRSLFEMSVGVVTPTASPHRKEDPHESLHPAQENSPARPPRRVPARPRPGHGVRVPQPRPRHRRHRHPRPVDDPHLVRPVPALRHRRRHRQQDLRRPHRLPQRRRRLLQPSRAGGGTTPPCRRPGRRTSRTTAAST